MKRENYNEVPRKYKMDEGKKKEILTNLQQVDNEVQHKKRHKIPLIPSLGAGVAALLVFILFASPIMEPLHDGGLMKEDAAPKQLDHESTQLLEKVMTSKDVNFRLFNESYKGYEDLNKVTGTINISFPSDLANELKSLHPSFRVRVSNENISVMSEKYNWDKVFNDESGSGLFKFEITLTKEEATQLKEKTVDLSLYVYDDTEKTSSQPIAHSKLKESKELEKLGVRPEPIKDLFSSEDIQLNVKDIKLTKEGSQEKLTGMVNLKLPNPINSDIHPSTLTYSVVLSGQESASTSKKYSGKSVFFNNQPNTAMIPFEILFNGEDEPHIIEGEAALYLHVYEDENTPLRSSKKSVYIKSLNLYDLYSDPQTTLRLDVVEEAVEAADLTIKNYVYMNSHYVVQNEEFNSLGKVYMSIITKQKKGDIKPYLYLNSSQNKGYIFEKKMNGKINVYQILLDKESDKWSVSETIHLPNN